MLSIASTVIGFFTGGGTAAPWVVAGVGIAAAAATFWLYTGALEDNGALKATIEADRAAHAQAIATQEETITYLQEEMEKRAKALAELSADNQRAAEAAAAARARYDALRATLRAEAIAKPKDVAEDAKNHIRSLSCGLWRATGGTGQCPTETP